jgi:hypothetical protein
VVTTYTIVLGDGSNRILCPACFAKTQVREEHNAFPDTHARGLSKREYIATAVMSGMASRIYVPSREASDFADTAVAIADALIARLAK